VIAELKKRSDEFQATLKSQIEAAADGLPRVFPAASNFTCAMTKKGLAA
jgi:hypothetical protein